MKKLIAMMLAVLTVASMAACAKKESGSWEEGGEPAEVQVETAEMAAGGESAEAVAQKAMEARNQFQYSGVLALVHENYVQYVAARLRMEVDEMLRMYDENAAGIRQETEKDKGAFTLSGEIGEVVAVEGDELISLQARYEDLYALTVTQAVEVPFTVTAEYESGSEESEEALIVVEIDGKWYLDLIGINLI